MVGLSIAMLHIRHYQRLLPEAEPFHGPLASLGSFASISKLAAFNCSGVIITSSWKGIWGCSRWCWTSKRLRIATTCRSESCVSFVDEKNIPSQHHGTLDNCGNTHMRWTLGDNNSCLQVKSPGFRLPGIGSRALQIPQPPDSADLKALPSTRNGVS